MQEVNDAWMQEASWRR